MWNPGRNIICRGSIFNENLQKKFSPRFLMVSYIKILIVYIEGYKKRYREYGGNFKERRKRRFIMIKCDFCYRELNENKFPPKNNGLSMCKDCFDVKVNFDEIRGKEKEERENNCSICDTENCKESEKEITTEWTIISEINNLKNSIYQIGCSNRQPEDKETIGKYITQIYNVIDKLESYLSGKKTEEKKELIFGCLFCKTPNCNEKHHRQKERLTKILYSGISAIKHSIDRIGKAKPEDRHINIFLLAIGENIDYIDICLYDRAFREEVKRRRIGSK